MTRWRIETRTRAIRRVAFVCPRCGVDRDGVEVAPRRWRCLFGLPVAPLERLDHVVRCDDCEFESDLDVLAVPTTWHLAAYLADGMRHAVATVVRACGDAGAPAEIRAAAIGAVRGAGWPYHAGQLDDDLVGLDDAGTTASLARLGVEMTVHGRQGILHRLASVAVADGTISEARRRALVDIGVALGMCAPHINGVLAVTANELEAA